MNPDLQEVLNKLKKLQRKGKSYRLVYPGFVGIALALVVTLGLFSAEKERYLARQSLIMAKQAAIVSSLFLFAGQEQEETKDPAAGSPQVTIPPQNVRLQPSGPDSTVNPPATGGSATSPDGNPDPEQQAGDSGSGGREIDPAGITITVPDLVAPTLP